MTRGIIQRVEVVKRRLVAARRVARSRPKGLGARLEAEPDPRELLRLYVRITRQISERCGDIVWTLLATQAVEPDVALVVQEG
jgi:hypothetical protein